jgi:urease accessory protein
LIVIEAASAVSPDSLAGKERDRLRASWEDRRRVRRKAITEKGREVALALPTGSVLLSGDVLFVGTDWYLEVEAMPEPVIALYPKDHPEALRAAFEIGNRHFVLALDGDRLLVPDDTAMEQLLTRLGLRWEKTTAVFNPIAGGHRHER